MTAQTTTENMIPRSQKKRFHARYYLCPNGTERERSPINGPEREFLSQAVDDITQWRAMFGNAGACYEMEIVSVTETAYEAPDPHDQFSEILALRAILKSSLGITDEKIDHDVQIRLRKPAP